MIGERNSNRFNFIAHKYRVKALVLFVLVSYLIIKWLHQEKRYMTDFPFLFSLGTFFYAGTKIYDMLIYAIYQNPLSSFTTLSSIESSGCAYPVLFKPSDNLTPILSINANHMVWRVRRNCSGESVVCG